MLDCSFRHVYDMVPYSQDDDDLVVRFCKDVQNRSTQVMHLVLVMVVIVIGYKIAKLHFLKQGPLLSV